MSVAAERKLRLQAQYGGDPLEPWRVRPHRATGWPARAEREAGDADARFVFLWIALYPVA